MVLDLDETLIHSHHDGWVIGQSFIESLMESENTSTKGKQCSMYCLYSFLQLHKSNNTVHASRFHRQSKWPKSVICRGCGGFLSWSCRGPLVVLWLQISLVCIASEAWERG